MTSQEKNAYNAYNDSKYSKYIIKASVPKLLQKSRPNFRLAVQAETFSKASAASARIQVATGICFSSPAGHSQEMWCCTMIF